VKRVRQFNYIPGKKMTKYREALLREYRLLIPKEKAEQR